LYSIEKFGRETSPSISLSDREGAVLHLRNNNSTSSSSFDSIFNIPARLNFILQKNLVEVMFGYVLLFCLLSIGEEVRW
jgi:hypothetical protein